MSALRRSLGVGQCIFFGVGSILGAGIYTLIGKVAGSAGNLTWLAFLIASFTAMLTAFAYAELSACFPKSGGEAVYARKAFGPRLGLVLGLLIALNGIISAATVSLGFAGYFAQLIDLPTLPVALGVIALYFTVNALGIRESSGVNIVLTIIEVLGLVVVIVAAFPSLGSVDLLEAPPRGMDGLFIAAALSFFAYVGFEDIVKLAEETRKPQRDIPIALFASNTIVLVMYSALALLVVNAMPHEQLAESEAPLAAIVEGAWGRAGAVVMIGAALCATSNTILSNILSSSRVLFHIGREHHGFQALGQVSTRRTPIFALVLVAVVAAGFALIGDIETVARIATITIFLTFLVVNASVIVLRVRHPELRRPFKVPFNVGGVPVITVLAICCTGILLYHAVAALLER